MTFRPASIGKRSTAKALLAIALLGKRAIGTNQTSIGETSGVAPVMKMIVFFKRRNDLTPEQFREHYETRHAPMALRLFPYIADYRRNYIRHDLQHRRTSGESIHTQLDFDAITEITFAAPDGYQRMQQDMTDATIRNQVVADEQRFLERSATLVLLVDEAVSKPA